MTDQTLPEQPVLALWNGVLPQWQASYEAWHAQEHVPERVTTPGLHTALRYRRGDGAPLYFTLYLLDSHAVLETPAYRAMVDAPTPWSAAMRPRLTAFQRQAAWLRSGVDITQVPWLRMQQEPGDVPPAEMFGSLRVADVADVASAHPLAAPVAAMRPWTLAMAPAGADAWQRVSIHHSAAVEGAPSVRPPPRMDLYAVFEGAAP